MTIPHTPFYTEVMSQAEFLTACLQKYQGEDAARLEEFRARAAGRWLAFAGMGSSLYAPYAAGCWLGGRRRWATHSDAGEILHYHGSGPPPEALPVLVSQSGESVELVRLAGEWRHREFIAITNNLESPLAKAAALALPLHAGTESGTSSKTFINTAAVSLLAAASLEDEVEQMLADLTTAADVLAVSLDHAEEDARRLHALLGWPAFLDVTARGPALAAAWQSSLILREAAGILGAGQSIGLLRHGPIHDIQPGRAVLVFVGRGPTSALAAGLVGDLLARGANVALVSGAAEVAVASSPNLAVFRVPAIPEHTFPIVAIVASELLACLWAAEQGIVPGERVEKVTRTE